MAFASCSRSRRAKVLLLAFLLGMPAPAFAADVKPTPILDVKHDGPVDFASEIAPILKKNCTACHNGAKAESGLSLETPQEILKGGDGGPGAVVGKGRDSLIVTRSALADDEQMPPAGNKVGANRLTADEIGLLKLWIDQGAADSAAREEKIVWQPLPAGMHSIFALALSPDGQYAACSRANQIGIYHMPTGRLVGRLTDPALLKSGLYDKPGVADVDFIRSLAFSPDGRTLASGGFRTIKLWQRTEAKSSSYFDGKHFGETALAAATADGRTLATVHGNEVQLADLNRRKPTHKLSGHTASITAVAFSMTGSRLATVSKDKTVRVWNTAGGKLVAVAKSPVEPTAVAITQNEMLLIVGATDGKCRSFVLPAETAASDVPLTVSREWSTADRPVTALAPVAGKPSEVVVADQAGNIVHWNAADVKQPIKKLDTTGVEIRALAVAPSGTKVVGLDAGNSLRMWNLADGKQTAEFKGDLRANRQVQAAERSVTVAKLQVVAETALLADAEKVAAAESAAAKKAEEDKVKAVKTQQEKAAALKKATDEKLNAEKASAAAAAEAKKTDESKAEAEATVAAAVAAEKGAADAKAAAEKTKAARTKLTAANTAATAAATKAKAAVAAIDKTLKPLDDATKAKTEIDSVMKSSDRAISSAAAAAKRAAAALPVAKQRIADAEKLQKNLEASWEAAKKRAADAEKLFRSLTFSADDKLLAVGGEDGLVHILAVETGAPLDVFVGSRRAVVGVAFTAADRLASVDDGGDVSAREIFSAWTWTRTVGGPTDAELEDRVTALDFSPDGRLLASGGGVAARNGELKIWNVATGKLVREVIAAHSDTVFCVRFSPDGKTLASGAADKCLKTFDVDTGTFARTFEGHTHHVLGVAWSADGRMLATGGADNAVKSWNVATGEQKKTTPGFGKEVNGIAFVGATNEAIASSGDKTVRMLKADLGQMTKEFTGAKDFLYCSAVSLDGQMVVAGGRDGVLRVWDVPTGVELKNLPAPSAAPVHP